MMPSQLEHELNKLRGELAETGEVYTDSIADLKDNISEISITVTTLDSKSAELNARYRKYESQLSKVRSLVKSAIYDIEHHQIKNVIASETLIHCNTTEKNQSTPAWTKLKETSFNGYVGTVRISFEGKESGGSGCVAKVYINGVSVTGNIGLTTSYATYAYIKDIQSGDLIQVYTSDAAEPQTAYIKNLKISGTVTTIEQTSQDP